MKRILCLLCLLFIITGCNSSNSKSILNKGENVKVVQSETKNIEYEEFNNGYLKMQIPKG